MSDDNIQPLQDRISKIVGDEERLNRTRKSAVEAQKAHRDSEKRTESAHLATMDRDREHQLGLNAEKERKFQEKMRKEGEELVNLSKEIRDDYIAETRHREAAKDKLQSKVTALESKLRSIESARP